MASTPILHDQPSVKITLVEFYFMGESTLSLPWKFERLMDLERDPNFSISLGPDKIDLIFRYDYFLQLFSK